MDNYTYSSITEMHFLQSINILIANIAYYNTKKSESLISKARQLGLSKEEFRDICESATFWGDYTYQMDMFIEQAEYFYGVKKCTLK